jgi:hypothetical protein
MKAAIAYLKTKLTELSVSEPISRAAGDIAQANSESDQMIEIERALDVLELVEDRGKTYVSPRQSLDETPPWD